MRFNLPCLLCVLLLGPTARAAESTDLDFVRGLRERQLADLALEYIKDLRKKQLPPDVATLLPLEEARAHVDLAQLDGDEASQAAHRNQARTLFETFLKTNSQHPLAAEANLEIARLVGLQAKAQLGRALRQDNKAAQRSELLKARARFEEAARLLQAAGKQIEGRLGNADAETRGMLQQAQVQAEFELALNLFHQAQTFTDTAELAKRGEILKAATTLFGKIAARDSRNPLCLQAKAWQGRCYQENDDPKAARKLYSEVIVELGEQAEAARRLARYFRLQVMARDPDLKKPVATLQDIQQGADRWLQDYRNYRNSPEGIGVRYEFGNALLKEGQLKPNTTLGQAQARDLLQRAQRIFQEIEQSDNDFTEQAREGRLSIILKLSSERSRGDISRLQNFEECYLRAQVEVAQINQAEKELKGEQLAGKRREHLKNIQTALDRAFDLADAKVTAQELADARYLFARSAFSLGDYYRAAVLGEDLARNMPRAGRAPAAGTYALFAYSQLLAESERAGQSGDILDADRRRLRQLAEYLEKTWPTDAAADVARHQLGRLLLQEKKYPEAVATLSRVSPTYTDSTRSLFQLGYAAQMAQRTESKPLPGRPPYIQIALNALRAVPPLADDADPATIPIYFEAKLTLGSLLYTQKNPAEAVTLGTALLKEVGNPTLALDSIARAELETKALGLQLLGRLGVAEIDDNARQYAKVREAVTPIVQQLKNPEQRGKLLELKDPDLLPALLGLALRANVQDNKINEARELVGLLQQFSPEQSREILKRLVQQLRLQVLSLREKGDAVKADLDRTVTNFTAFLDQLAKQQEQKPNAEMTLFIAQSYSSLDNHRRAAELVEKVSPPADEKDPKPVQVYRAARILAAREYRLDKQYDKADALLQGTQASVGGKPGWGQQNMDVQKERIFLLQDQEKYSGAGGAILAWNGLMKQLQPRIREDVRLKEQYFECYYHLTWCLFKNGQKQTDPAKKLAASRQAARFVVQLQQTQPDMGGEANKKRFEELVKAEPELREQVEQLQKSANGRTKP